MNEKEPKITENEFLQAVAEGTLKFEDVNTHAIEISDNQELAETPSGIEPSEKLSEEISKVEAYRKDAENLNNESEIDSNIIDQSKFPAGFIRRPPRGSYLQQKAAELRGGMGASVTDDSKDVFEVKENVLQKMINTAKIILARFLPNSKLLGQQPRIGEGENLSNKVNKEEPNKNGDPNSMWPPAKRAVAKIVEIAEPILGKKGKEEEENVIRNPLYSPLPEQEEEPAWKLTAEQRANINKRKADEKPENRKEHKPENNERTLIYGGDSGIRTLDLVIKSDLLYQLS